MFIAIATIAALFASQATSPAPDPTLPPSPSHAAYVAEGRGVQIYRCTQQDSTYTWVFQSPEATLFDPNTHQPTGSHGEGPTWTWKDGSAVSGKVLQKSPSPDPANIPWLLLATQPSGTKAGALSSVTMVRRSETHGGNAPLTGCDAAHTGSILRVPYSATYTFYTAP
jgi:Protein of unknown function (DUF3455)